MIPFMIVLMLIVMSGTAVSDYVEPLHTLVEGDVLLVRGTINHPRYSFSIRLCDTNDCNRLTIESINMDAGHSFLDSVRHATEDGNTQRITLDNEVKMGDELSVKMTVHKRQIYLHFNNDSLSQVIETPYTTELNNVFLNIFLMDYVSVRVMDKRSAEELYAEFVPELVDGDVLSIRGKIESVEFFLFHIDLCTSHNCTEMPLRIRICTHATTLYAVKGDEFTDTSTFPTELQSGQEFAVDIEVHEDGLKILFGKGKEFHDFSLGVAKEAITYFRVTQLDGISSVSPLENAPANDKVDPVYSFSVRKMNLEDEFIINGTFLYGLPPSFNISLCPSPSCSEMELIIRVEPDIAYIDTFLMNPDEWLNSQSVPTICRVGKPFGITIRMEEYIYRNLFYNMDDGTKQNTHLQYNYYNRTTYMEIRAAPSPSVLKRVGDMPKRLNVKVKYNPGPQVGPEDTDKDYFASDPNAVAHEEEYETTTPAPPTEAPETTEEDPEEEDPTMEFILFGIAFTVYGIFLNFLNL